MEVALQILLATILLGPAFARPGSYFPINSQVPPIARLQEPFEFIFSPYTFTSSSNSPLSYSLVGNPEWLSIDSDARKVYGTPQEENLPEGEVVGLTFSLVGKDEDGVAAMDVTLVVSRNSSPRINKPLSEQISNFGTYSLPASILSTPSTDFWFEFAADTFSGDGLSYYAVMGDNSPLPSWVSFDGERLVFSGTTPAVETLVQPPQIFTFQLIASDVIGFSATAIRFSLLVGGRQLRATTDLITIEAAPGQEISYPGPLEEITVDSAPIDPAEVESISATNLPDWLTLDSRTGALSGTPQSNTQPLNITLTVQDTYLGKVSLDVWIQMATNLFKTELPTEVDITAGEPFELDLSPYFLDKSNVEVSTNTEPVADWIQFDPTSMVLSGKVPVAADGSDIQVIIDARAKGSSSLESRTMTLAIGEATGNSGEPDILGGNAKSITSTLTTQISSSTEPAETTGTTGTAASSGGTTEGLGPYTLALLVIAPILFLVLLGLLIYCLIRRRKKRNKRVNVKDISGPLPETFVRNGTSTTHGSSGHPHLAEIAKHYDIGEPGPHPAIPPLPRQSAMTTWSALRRSRTEDSLESSLPGTALSTHGSHGVSNEPPLLPPVGLGKSGSRLQKSGNRRDTWLSNDEFLQSSREGNNTKSFLNDTSLYDEGNPPSTGSSGEKSNEPPNFVLEERDPSFRTALDVSIHELKGSIQNTPDQAYDYSIGPQDIEGPSRRRSKMLAVAVASGRTTPNVSTVPPPSGSQKETLANRAKSGTGFNFISGWKSRDDGPSPLNRRSHLTSTTAVNTSSGSPMRRSKQDNYLPLDPVGPAVVAPKQARLSVQKPNRESHRRSGQKWIDGSGSPKPAPPPPAGTPNPMFWGSTLGPGTEAGAGIGGARDSDGSIYPVSIPDAFPRPPTGVLSGDGVLRREESLTGKGPRNSFGIAYKDLIRKSPYHPSIQSMQSYELAGDLPAELLALEPVLETTRSREDGGMGNRLPLPEKSPRRPTTAGKGPVVPAFPTLGAIKDGSNIRSSKINNGNVHGDTNKTTTSAKANPKTPDWRGSKDKDELLSPSHWDMGSSSIANPNLSATWYSNNNKSTLLHPGTIRRPAQTKSSEALAGEVKSRFSDVSLRMGSGNSSGPTSSGGGGGWRRRRSTSEKSWGSKENVRVYGHGHGRGSEEEDDNDEDYAVYI